MSNQNPPPNPQNLPPNPPPNPANPPPNPAPAAAANPLDQAQIQFFQGLVDQLRQQNRVSTPKSIPCGNYRQGEDFDQWVSVFIDSVKAANNLRAGDARLEQLCLTWLPTKKDSL